MTRISPRPSAALAALALCAPGALLAGGCAADVPDAPSFQEHVLPILAANCVRCHGDPPIGGAPPGFRLDTYADVAADDQTMISGAGSYAALIALRAADPARPMPPRFPLDDAQIETLERWVQGVPPGEPPPRGAPRPGNRDPEVAIEATTPRGAAVDLVVRVGDPDRDLVAGELRAHVGAEVRVIGPVRSGRVALSWDTTGVTPGSYELSARVDDGAASITIPLGQLAVGGP